MKVYKRFWITNCDILASALTRLSIKVLLTLYNIQQWYELYTSKLISSLLNFMLRIIQKLFVFKTAALFRLQCAKPMTESIGIHHRQSKELWQFLYLTQLDLPSSKTKPKRTILSQQIVKRTYEIHYR